MTRRSLWLLAAGAIVAAGSCSDSSPAPTAIPRPSAPVTPVRLELVVPEYIPLDSSAQLRLREIRSDGSSVDLTSGIQWSSSEPSVLQVDAQGVATASTVGESRVTARLDLRTASNNVLVMPAGTFRMTGRLLEAGIAVSDATVSVIAGTGQGQSSPTNSSGVYVLLGVAGSITLQITKAGYQTVIQNLDVIGNTRYEDISIVPERQREPLGGEYRLTISATGCSDIPAEWQRRTYDARVEQRGSRVEVFLSGADFLVFTGSGNHFGGSYGLDGYVTFVLAKATFYGYDHQTSPDVVERVTPSSAIMISGTASTRLTDGVMSGELSGTFTMTDGISNFFPPYAAECRSSGHQFELRRR